MPQDKTTKDQKSNNDDTALILAAKETHFDIVKALIGKQALEETVNLLTSNNTDTVGDQRSLTLFQAWMQEKPLSKAPTKEVDDEKLRRTLKTAMRYANYTCVLGASNKIKDITETGGWVNTASQKALAYFPYIKYKSLDDLKKEDHGLNIDKILIDKPLFSFSVSVGAWIQKAIDPMPNRAPRQHYITPKTWRDPLQNIHFHLTPTLSGMLINEGTLRQERVGNCGDRSDLVAAFLWRHSQEIHSVECIFMDNIDHAFIAVNRDGNLYKPETWTTGYIVDGWYEKGLIYPAKDFLTQIKDIEAYCLQQIDALTPYGFSFSQKDKPHLTRIGGCTYRINPQTEAYPRYDQFDDLRDDYYIDDHRFKGGYQEHKTTLAHHKKTFESTLKEINSLETKESRITFFKAIKIQLAPEPVIQETIKTFVVQ